MSNITEKFSALSEDKRKNLIGVTTSLALLGIIGGGIALQDSILPESVNEHATTMEQKKACNRAARANEGLSGLLNDTSYTSIRFEGGVLPLNSETGEPIDCDSLGVDLGL